MYLETVFFLELFLALSIIGLFWFSLKFNRLATIKQQQLLKKHNKSQYSPYYSTYILRRTLLKKMLKLSPTPFDKLLKKISTAPHKALSLLHPLLKKNPKNTLLNLLFADICLYKNNKILLNRTIENVKISWFTPSHIKAKYYFLTAQNYFYKTDMDNASANIDKALKIYRHKNFLYEEAECYILLAQIYRISGFSDIAYTMLKEAEKIFQIIPYALKITEIKAYFGLWALGNQNYKDALKYFDDALTLSDKYQISLFLPHIKNWQGLIYFLEKKYFTARKYFVSASKLSTTDESKAFASEMLARIELKSQNYTSSITKCDQATREYTKAKNITGILEMLYLKAEIFYLKKEYAKSKKILRKLITSPQTNNSMFYLANAYTLLGCIELDTQNLNLAKTLFKQSLDLENNKNRQQGQAIDYNNLAEIAILEGDKTNATYYLTKALNCAKDLEDEELRYYLEQKLQ